MAGRAAAAGFGVVDHFFEGGQAVVHHGPANMPFVDAEAFTDQLALLMLLLKAFAAKMGDGRTQRFLAHHRAVHFFRRQTVEVVGDLLVGDLPGFGQGVADNQLRQRGRGGDGTAAAEGLEARLLDDLGLRINPQHQAQRIAAA